MGARAGTEQFGEEQQPWDFLGTTTAYTRWVDAPSGHAAALLGRVGIRARKASQGLRLGAAMPAPVLDNEKLYWWAWLMPDRDISSFVHPLRPRRAEGDKSTTATRRLARQHELVRVRYCYNIGTMNFNHTCPAAALLAARSSARTTS